ncbi:MAG: ATP-binding protein [Acidobacteriaceae bacterium]
MRRRKKPVTNDSESTGKIGHEIPQDQPTPLQPSYPQPLGLEDTANVSAREKHNADVYSDADRGSSTDESENVSATSPGHEPTTAPPDRASNGRPGSRGRSRSRSRSGRGDASSATAAAEESTLVHETQPESLAQPPAPLEAAKSPKGYVVLAIGLPGSGKTTWFKRRGVTPLSSDMLRSILFDDITEQRYQGLVFSTLRSLLRARLIAKMPWNYVDATNLSPHERRQWIKMARSFGYEVHAVFFDVPFEVCKDRNARRDRMLNEEDMAKMQERLRPPSFTEGFHKITVVRVKNSPATPTEDFNA